MSQETELEDDKGPPPRRLTYEKPRRVAGFLNYQQTRTK